MSSRAVLLSVLVTSSLFLVHCSSGDETPKNTAGTSNTTGGTGATGGTSATGGTGGTTGGTGTGGTSGTATGGTGGTAMGGGGGSAAGQGGTGGALAGQAGVSMGGAGAGAMGGSAGSAGSSTAGMSGAGGSAGSGMGGMNGGMGQGGMNAAGSGGSGGTGAFTLTSSVITEGGMFPDTNTCAGADTSPDLTWTSGPSGTMSYAVILLDTSNSLNHWVIWDIPGDTTMLMAGLDTGATLTMPNGAKQRSFSGNGFVGPCPNGMDHVYKFTVYALPVATLSGATTTMSTMQLSMAVMNANPLASASLSAHSAASMN